MNRSLSKLYLLLYLEQLLYHTLKANYRFCIAITCLFHAFSKEIQE